MAPLSKALLSGRVAEGDQVCIAAEDPVNLIPLQYLLLSDGRVVVEAFSLTRVASFSDALAISRSEPMRPTQGAVVFVPADDREIEHKQRAFQEIQTTLSGALSSLHVKTGGHIDAQEIAQVMHQNHVIHIDAHGYFPPQGNPYEASGLLVSDGRNLATRKAESPCVLTPSQIVANKYALNGSHVTMQACVLGLGRPGRGGDVLGHGNSVCACVGLPAY